MGSTCVVGLQWGDEAKGKIVDLLCDRHDAVVRYQGGANAGHTVVADGVTYKLSLVPTGILRPGIDCVIGNGVVIHPPALLKEIETLAKQGVEPGGRLHVSDRAHVILPYHLAEERLTEESAVGGRPPRHDPARDRPVLSRQGRPGPRRPGRRPLPPRAVPRAPRPDRRLQEPAAHGDAPRLRRRSTPTPWPTNTSATPSGCGRSFATRRPGCTRRSRRASGSCSKGRRARCSTSTTAAIPT